MKVKYYLCTNCGNKSYGLRRCDVVENKNHAGGYYCSSCNCCSCRGGTSFAEKEMAEWVDSIPPRQQPGKEPDLDHCHLCKTKRGPSTPGVYARWATWGPEWDLWFCDNCYRESRNTAALCSTCGLNCSEETEGQCGYCYANSRPCLRVSCRRRVRLDQKVYGGWCKRCHRDRHERIFQAYSASAVDHLGERGERKKGEHLFGVEIEVEVPLDGSISRQESVTKMLQNHFSDLIIKDDSSLRNGYELVSPAATLDYHRELWERILKTDPPPRKLYGIKSFGQSTCGTHVHISRSELQTVEEEREIRRKGSPFSRREIVTRQVKVPTISALVLGKLRFFMTHNKEFTQWIAQRKPGSTYAAYGKPCKITARSGRNLAACGFSNKDTLELRIFAGNMRYEAVMKNIEFTDAIVKFLRDAGIPELTPGHFYEFVMDSRKTWPELVEYLNRLEGDKREHLLTKDYLIRHRKNLKPKEKEVFDKGWKDVEKNLAFAAEAGDVLS